MKALTVLLCCTLFICSNRLFAQKAGPRFGVAIAPYSAVFYPKKFTSIATPTNYEWRIYEDGVYDINYAKVNFSLRLYLGFNVNWINREKWRLAQCFSLGVGQYKATTNLTLTSHGDSVATNVPYATGAVPVGYQSKAHFEGSEYLLFTDLLLFRKLENNWEVGFGVGFQQFKRVLYYSESISTEGYVPTFLPRSASIVTNCFNPTLILDVEKTWSYLSVFASYSQTIYILQSETYFVKTNGKQYPEPSSLNEASRLPGRLMVGCRFNWGN